MDEKTTEEELGRRSFKPLLGVEYFVLINNPGAHPTAPVHDWFPIEKVLSGISRTSTLMRCILGEQIGNFQFALITDDVAQGRKFYQYLLRKNIAYTDQIEFLWNLFTAKDEKIQV